jgi:hypothetical protein
LPNDNIGTLFKATPTPLADVIKTMIKTRAGYEARLPIAVAG